MASKENPVEIVSERQLCRKVFDIGNGQKRMVIRTSPLHYEDSEGNLQDVSTDIENGGVHKCAYDIDLLPDKIGYSGTDPSGKTIYLELEDVTYKTPTITKGEALYEEIEPGVDFKLSFSTLGVRAERILKNVEANKTAKYKSIRQKGALGKLINKGLDNEQRPTKIALQKIFPTDKLVDERINEGPVSPEIEEKRNRDEYSLIQTFEDQVMKMNPETRKREWSSDVTYPVTIDPTSTFSIATGADDGGFMTSGGASQEWGTNNNYTKLGTYSLSGTHYSAWLRFSGITIPQGATINSANINIHTWQPWGGANVDIMAFSGTVNPTNATTAASTANKIGTLNYVQISGTTPTNSSYRSKTDYVADSLNVTSLVQLLVTAYEYSNQSMVFTLKGVLSKCRLYMRDWGTSKDAELVIDYEGAEPVASTSGFMTGSKYWG